MLYWTDSYSTNIEVIDEDHKSLFGLVNSLSKAREAGEDSGHISLAIDALNDYAQNHFKREEALMMLCGYSAQARHEEGHQAFRDIATSLKHLYYVCPDMVSLEGVISYLEEWLKNHIAFSDHAYLEEMRRHKDVIDLASKRLQESALITF